MVDKNYEEYEYWFISKPNQEYLIIDKTKKYYPIGSIRCPTDNDSIELWSYTWNNDIDEDDVDVSQVEFDFKAFKTRPEFKVGQFAAVQQYDILRCENIYSTLMQGCLLHRAYLSGKNPDSYMGYIYDVLNWVDSTDFYRCPASTIYHESFEHGLVYHTLKVYDEMLNLIQNPKFRGIDIYSATLCCLVHDWCKIGLYESYLKNVKNEETGKWEKQRAYKHSKSISHPFGHGASSMYMASKMFKLTEEEALAIRWHMSMFNVASNEINDYQAACERYPLVHLIQFADQLSIVSY